MTVPRYSSTLASALHGFVVQRQALGYADRSVKSLLAHFDRYLVKRGWTTPVLTRELIEDWVASGGPLKPPSRARRWHVIRLFGRFLAQTRPDSYVPGRADRAHSQPRFRPHIYTPQEIRRLMNEAARLTPVGALRPHTYVTLLGLLYCTGLRISEALALRLSDVDLDTGVLWIQESKFHKSRLVPLASVVTAALDRYRARRAARGLAQQPDAAFFVNEWKRPCTYPVVCATFLAVARRAGVRKPAGHPGPRLHDLRHTFAVHRLLAWYRDGGDVQARLPLLADYLGHVSIVSTQVYLEITAELLGEAAQRFRPPTLETVDKGGGAS